MSDGLTGLLELRLQLQLDAGLDGFFNARYGQSARHIVGFKKAFNISEYPFICYVPNEAVRGKLGGDLEVISLIIGVYDQAITDEVSGGLASLARAEALIITALNTEWAGSQAQFLGTVKVADDFGVAHPVYRKELQIPLKVRMA